MQLHASDYYTRPLGIVSLLMPTITYIQAMAVYRIGSTTIQRIACTGSRSPDLVLSGRRDMLYRLMLLTRPGGRMSRASVSRAARSENPKVACSIPEPAGSISGRVKSVTLKLMLVTS